MLHALTVSSINALLTIVSSQINQTPSKSTILGWTSVLDDIPEEIPALAVSIFTARRYERVSEQVLNVLLESRHAVDHFMEGFFRQLIAVVLTT